MWKDASTTVDIATIEQLDSFNPSSQVPNLKPLRDEPLADSLNATDWLQELPYFAIGPPDARKRPWASIHIAHAFAVRARKQDRIQLSLHYIVVIIAANLFKLIIMLTILVTDRSKYIVTPGDAVSSFLSLPDTTTERRCLLEDDKVLGQIGPPACTNKTQTRNAVNTGHSQRAESMADIGWHKRTLSHFTLIRKEQARLILPL